MAPAAPLYSTLGADAELGELVELFVAEMPDRIAALERALADRDWGELRRAAHQLKGAAGSYGFGPLTPLAAAVEDTVRSERPADTLRGALEELLAACRQVRGGAPRERPGAGETPAAIASTDPRQQQ